MWVLMTLLAAVPILGPAIWVTWLLRRLAVTVQVLDPIWSYSAVVPQRRFNRLATLTGVEDAVWRQKG